MWHKRYYSGKATKQDSQDFLEGYYTDSGEQIKLLYTDFRHNKCCGYVAYVGLSGSSIGTFKTLGEAQSAVARYKMNKGGF